MKRARKKPAGASGSRSRTPTRRAARFQRAKPPLPPSGLYLDPAEWELRLAGLERLKIPQDGLEPVPRFARERDLGDALAAFVGQQLDQGRAIALAARSRRDLRRLAGHVRRAGGNTASPAESWQAIRSAAPESVVTISADTDAGFVDEERRLAVIRGADFFGRSSESANDGRSARAELGMTEFELRPGDAV